MSGESARKEDVQVGDEMPDGTIYAGISPDTHQPMYATPRDAPGTNTFNVAAPGALTSTQLLARAPRPNQQNGGPIRG